jgi:DNA-binding response OmpR family regulator
LEITSPPAQKYSCELTISIFLAKGFASKKNPMNRTSPASLPMKILFVSDARADQVALRRSLAQIPCKIVTTDTYRKALQLLQRDRISIIICESNLRDGTWRDMLNSLNILPEKPIFIVSSRCAEEYLWAEVLNLGGFEVIAKPFNIQELRNVIESACLAARLTHHRLQRINVTVRE